jgi:hypothetical protein
MIKSLLYRIISDYFIPNRIGQYEELLRTALEEGYTVMTHRDFVAALGTQSLPSQRILLVRHDIDTDPDYCLQWLAVEQKLGVHTSFFFRLTTAKPSIMKAVVASGGECGYHYEELADFAKTYRIKDRETIELNKVAIQEAFVANLKRMESLAGSSMVSVVSHGDFVNRKLQMPNHAPIDAALLRRCAIEYEGYETRITERYSINISDHTYPAYFRGNISPMEAIRKHLPVVHLLIHPRHWRSSWYWNTRENLTRLMEGMAYRFLPVKPIERRS